MTLALTLLVFGLAISQISATPLIPTSLRSKLDRDGSANIMISLKADTETVLAQIRTQNFVNSNIKVTSMVEELKKFTSESQLPIISILASHKSVKKVQGFHIVNRIYVEGATQEIVDSLKDRNDIGEIRLSLEFAVPPPNSIKAPSKALKELEWGVVNIGAPAVWAAGYTGEGVVVSNIDTGVRSTHVDLAPNWRKEYGWFDPYAFTLLPGDQNGQGSHTMGTIAGQNGTGVAPGSKWIACKGCNTFLCEEAAILSCGQWTVCPTLTDGTAPNCSMRPHVSSNSWGGGNESPFYDGVLNAMYEAGISPVFGVGSGGPQCSSVASPGDRPLAIGVGSTDPNNQLTPYSSQGPTLITNRVKPDLTAPGDIIRSAGSSSDVSYEYRTGSSMSASHVAGAFALLLSKNPGLTREELNDALQSSAFRPKMDNITCTGGIDDPANPWPNNAYGYGKIDVAAAIEIVKNSTVLN